MKLLKLLFRDNRLPLTGIVLLSLCSAVLSVGVIAFINLKLIRLEGELATTLLSFLGLLALLLISSGAGQVALHTLGHRFVYRLPPGPAVVSARVNPDGLFPDVNPGNDAWTAPAGTTP